MRRNAGPRAFALVLTLIMMAMIITIIIGYLMTTRSDRAASSFYANRLKAKTIADSGLAAAEHLLRENTRYGNYITAMPAPSPSPAPHRTEVYRPVTNLASTDDYLRLDNAIGEALISRAVTAAAAGSQVDARPTAAQIATPAAGSSFEMTALTPALTATNSYNFNQTVRVGGTTGWLVDPDAQPAYGQWVRVRNSGGELVGRYAYYIEDESMKVNVNVAGNNLGGANMRVNDLTLPLPAASPASQIQEVNPSAVLPSTAGRNLAMTQLAALGPAGDRLRTSPSIGLQANWNGTGAGVPKLADYIHTITVMSKDDVTTARGWTRLDLNKLVADAQGGGNAAKVAAAHQIADWIRDAWTGPVAFNALKSYQMFNDERLRLQLAANIVDYIDTDSIPTDMGNYPAGDPNGAPILGIEKIPYLVELDVVYNATGATPDTGVSQIGVSFRFNFMNMFETDLKLGDYVGSIRIKGIPVLYKNNKEFDHESDTFDIIVGGAGVLSIPNDAVPWGPDNSPNGVAGAKTFRTGEVLSGSFTYPTGGTIARFESGLVEVDVLGKNGERLDSTKIALSDREAKFDNSSSTALSHDFLPARKSAASINGTYEAVVSATGSINPINFGDPRYRPAVMTKRWYNLGRTDTTRFTPNGTVGDDTAEIDSRAYSVDWYDYIGNRPLLFCRNGPMLSVGELGNVSACEYPWRTLYLQYAGRPENTSEADVIPSVQDRRGSSVAAKTNPALLPQDWVFMDLFRTSQDKVRSGSLNINTQANGRSGTSAVSDQGTLASLFYGVPADQLPLTTGTAMGDLFNVISQRRSAVAPVAAGGPGAAGGTAPIDNDPRRPYFTIGQLAPDIGWLIDQSENSKTTGNGRSRTTTVYSVLRNVPATKSQWSRNYGTDMQIEEPYRKVSNSITTRGNVFRVLYVGQAIKDINKNGQVDGTNEIVSEFLGEGFIEREGVFTKQPALPGSTAQIEKTTDSKYKILTQRTITE